MSYLPVGLAMVLDTLSTTEPLTASEVCQRLPMMLPDVDSALATLQARGGARVVLDEVGRLVWFRVRP